MLPAMAEPVVRQPVIVSVPWVRLVIVTDQVVLPAASVVNVAGVGSKPSFDNSDAVTTPDSMMKYSLKSSRPPRSAAASGSASSAQNPSKRAASAAVAKHRVLAPHIATTTRVQPATVRNASFRQSLLVR